MVGTLWKSSISHWPSAFLNVSSQRKWRIVDARLSLASVEVIFASTATSTVAELEPNDFSATAKTLGSPLLWRAFFRVGNRRSEEHTSELQSRFDLVCR